MPSLSETFRIGQLEVTALSDGAPRAPLGWLFHNVEAQDWVAAVGIASPEEPMPFNYGSFLIREQGRTTLIDTGFGTQGRTMGAPGGSELLKRIAELGVQREEVDAVLHTHLHFDHCGWNVNDDEGGALTFPNATFYLSQAEFDYWTGEASDTNPMAAGARSRILPVHAAGHVETFEGEFAVGESLTMLPTPGHTPGHCSVMVASQGEHLLILGDAAHHPTHLEHHDWVSELDMDPTESTRSRTRVVELAVERQALVTGGHFPILTLGRVHRVEAGYKWEPFG